MDVNVVRLEAVTSIYFLLVFFLGVNNDCKKFLAAFFLLLFFGLFDLFAIKAVVILFTLFDLFAEGAEFGPGFAFGFLDVFNFTNALAASLFDTILLFHYKLILSRLSFSSNSLRSPGESIRLPVAMDSISGPVKCIALSRKSLNASIVTGTRG
jgi:hypothetical protein